MHKKGLDEMQLQKRNAVGHQTLILTVCLLLLDAALYGAGVRWAEYPVNALAILALCSGIYAVRIIAANALAGPAAKVRKPLLKAAAVIVLAALAAAAAVVFWKSGSDGDPGGIGAVLLFVLSCGALAVAAVT